MYYTKGSGSNGVNTVYFVDTTGKACPNGVGVPQRGAQLPTSPIAYNPALIQTQGVAPYNMCILQRVPDDARQDRRPRSRSGSGSRIRPRCTSPTRATATTTFSTTTGTYTDAAAQTTAGLQKWTFNRSTGAWQLAYTLQSGLDLGQPYTVRGYPTGDNAVTGLPWSPATDGLRNITGRVNRDGTATIWGITSTVSGSGDQGADPNKLVAITDRLSATTRRRRVVPDGSYRHSSARFCAASR